MKRGPQAWLVSACACLAGALSSAPAGAAPLGATIEVERKSDAESCPGSGELTGKVERILQRRLTSEPNAGETLRVSVVFSSNGEEYSAEVHSLGAKPGERLLKDRGHDCSALAQAVSVAIALLLDRELEQKQPEPAEARPPAAVPAAPKPVSTNDDATTSTPPRVELRGSLEGGVAFAFAGPGSALLSEQVGVRAGRNWLFDAGFNAVLPGTTRFDEGEVRSTLVFGSLRGCYTWGDRFSLGPCALVALGRLRGVGIGYPTVASQDLLWTALGASVVIEGPVWGRVFWGLSGALWLPTRRSTFSVENLGIAWKSSTFAESVSARLGFRIW